MQQNNLDFENLEYRFDLILKSVHNFPINLEEAYEWIGFTRKDSAVRLLENNFTQNKDYTSLRSKVERAVGATFKDIYKLSTDCFKKLCMLAQTPKGKEVRQYFIDCENKLKQVKQSTPINEDEMILQSMQILQKRCNKLQDRLNEIEPVLNQISNSNGDIAISEFAKLCGIGSKRMFEFLRTYSILMKNNQPYQHYIDNGWLVCKDKPYEIKHHKSGDKQSYTYIQTYVTPKGIIELTKFYQRCLSLEEEWYLQ